MPAVDQIDNHIPEKYTPAPLVKLLGVGQANIMLTIFKSKEKKSTPFSEFIRNASARDKKRVYSSVLKKATDRQLSVIHRAQAAK